MLTVWLGLQGCSKPSFLDHAFCLENICPENNTCLCAGVCNFCFCLTWRLIWIQSDRYHSSEKHVCWILFADIRCRPNWPWHKYCLSYNLNIVVHFCIQFWHDKLCWLHTPNHIRGKMCAIYLGSAYQTFNGGVSWQGFVFCYSVIFLCRSLQSVSEFTFL